MPPTVSVILPTYNRAWSLERAITSVLCQAYGDYELIVVNDGSIDATQSLLDTFSGRIRVIAQENRGVSAARNAGIRTAEGKLLAFIDSDDEWKPQKLGRQLEYMEANPEMMICQCVERWIRNGKFVNIPNTHKKIGGNIFSQSLEKCMVTVSSVIMRRELLDEVGLFNESLPACEDYDLWLRIAYKYPIGLLGEELLVRYGGHADQLSAAYAGNDRYRIRAILNVLEWCPLSAEQRSLANTEFKKKCRVYGNGCIKRGKTEEGERFLKLAEGCAA